jgi:hypothetical protein
MELPMEKRRIAVAYAAPLILMAIVLASSYALGERPCGYLSQSAFRACVPAGEQGFANLLSAASGSHAKLQHPSRISAVERLAPFCLSDLGRPLRIAWHHSADLRLCRHGHPDCQMESCILLA